MAFTANERDALLAVKGVGPTSGDSAGATRLHLAEPAQPGRYERDCQ